MEGSVYSVVEESEVSGGSRVTNGSNGSRDIGDGSGVGVPSSSGAVVVGAGAARVGECLEFETEEADGDVEGDGDQVGSPDAGCTLLSSTDRTVLAAGVGLSPHSHSLALHGARGRSPYAGASIDSEVIFHRTREFVLAPC